MTTKINRRVRRGGDYGDAAEDVFYEFEPEIGDLLRDFAAFRVAAESWISDWIQPIVLELDLMGAAAHFALTELQGQPRQPPQPRREAFVLLVTRAVQTIHEITALLRCGLHRGAHARWRTLFEIAVVSEVLAQGNQHTARRWLRHGWVLTVRDVDRTGVRDNALDAVARRESARAIRTYGKEFRGDYGWASELTGRRMGQRNPKFAHLIQLANMQHLVPSYAAAHHHVYADTLGAYDLVSGEQVHHGAEVVHPGSLAAVTIDLANRVIDATTRVWMDAEFKDTSYVESIRSLVQEIDLVAQRNVHVALSDRTFDDGTPML